METRKIQLAGGTTYTVSIPKEWASEHDVEAGATVRVDPHADGSLVVRTDGHENGDPDPLTVAADDADPATLSRRVRAAYRTGRTTVELTSDVGFDVDQRAAVRSTAQDLLGVDVVEESDDRIVCESLLDSADVSVEQSLHQLRFVALSALREAVAALDGDRGDPRSVDDRAAEASRLAALVARQFERTLVDPSGLDDLGVARSSLLDYAAVARRLERVAGHAATVADVAGRSEEPFSDDAASAVDATATDVRDLVERATDAVLDGADADAACDLVADADAVGNRILDRSPGADRATDVAPVTHALAATADCAAAIAAVALRAAVRPGER